MDNFYPLRPASPITGPEATLEALTHRAEQELQSQPLPTQHYLTNATREIFTHYTKHGTSTSLRSAITRYFKAGSHDSNNYPLRLTPPLPPDYTPPPSDPKDSRMVDEESRKLVRDMPFYVDRKLHIRKNVKIPEGLLEGIDRIFRIYQAEAEAMLSHHCEKYGDEAIFRVGIRSLILSRSHSLFESTTSHPLGLDPETRLFFLQVYERHPDLNIAEQRLLARSARVDTDVIEAFWQTLTTLRTPYLAMRTVMAARELRKQARYLETVRLQNAEILQFRTRRLEMERKREAERLKGMREEGLRREGEGLGGAQGQPGRERERERGHRLGPLAQRRERGL